MLGAVLTGGASSRMGRDKSLVEVDGIPMAAAVANALRAGGAAEVLAVGGDADALTALGLRVVVDAFPGDGPLGGIITALRAAGDELLVTAPCDMPWLTGEHVRALVDTLSTAHDAHVAHSAQHLFAAWRPSALAILDTAFANGERAPKRALAKLTTRVVELPVGRWSVDVDRPDDLLA